MPRISSENKYLKHLMGINLWHADMSSCSQRVRIALAEKALEFQSHLIDLQVGKNASATFQDIHPQGLVPAMVIDGALIVESIDIIDEVDRCAGNSTLRPNDSQNAREMEFLMQRASDAHPALKLLTFEFLFSAMPPPPKKALMDFQRAHKNEHLKKFHRDFAKGFSRSRVSEAVSNSRQDFEYLESKLLDGREFLSGPAFSLADIAWMPNLHRFALFGWSFTPYPKLNAWFGRVKMRPSYKLGLLDWEPPGFVDLVTPKIIAREQSGDGVGAYL